jgi:SAM-dependent methyltransferase
LLSATSWIRLRHDLPTATADLSPFGVERSLALTRLALREDERVLLVSRSPASDLELVPKGVRGVVAGYGKPTMDSLGPVRSGLVGMRLDPESFDLPDETFDAVALLGALEGVEDPAHTLAEAARVVREGGRVSVLDRFHPIGLRPALLRRAAVPRTPGTFRSPELELGAILERSRAPLAPVSDEACPPPSALRLVLLRKALSARARMPLLRAWSGPMLPGLAVPA